MTDAELIDLITRIVISDRVAMGDINACGELGALTLAAFRPLFGWEDPQERIARGEVSAVEFVQALHIARNHPERLA